MREDRGVTSKAGYWIGGGLILCAVAGAILWAVVAVSHIVSLIDDFQHVQIPGSENVRLEARKYVIYVEGPGADRSVPPVRIQITDPRTQTPVPLQPYTSSLTYSFNTKGSAQATVTPSRAGVYRVRTGGVDAQSGYQIAIGESVGGKIVSTIVGAFVVGGVLGISGIALLIVTGVRRSRRRQRQPPGGWPPPGAVSVP
jgi:hypothetical protein